MTRLTEVQRSSQTYATVYGAADFADGAKEAIEALIDKFDLARVLQWTAEVCYMKSQHVEENWQDQGLASEWTKAGHKVIVAGGTIPVRHVSGER